MQVRALLLQVVPHLHEGIEYKMLNYTWNGKSIFHLNAQKHYVSLYIGTINKVANADELLKGLDRGKGCIRIKKSVSIADTQLSLFIGQVMVQYIQGNGADC